MTRAYSKDPEEARQHMSFAGLKRLLPQQVDQLPSPAEFRGTTVEGRGKSKQAVEVRRRKRWEIGRAHV